MTTNRTARYSAAPEDYEAYRLWHTLSSPGSPNIILVHGAVIPLPTTLHRISRPNNCFSQLERLLLNIRCNYNVWSFEYADELIPGLLEPGYVNYGCLSTYGTRLTDAIGIVRSSTQDFRPVNIIAHSMGGLVARYAAQHMPAGSVNRLITLDTGHLGFALAGIADDVFVEHLPPVLQPPMDCSLDAAPGSAFMQDLTAGFANRHFELVSLAANDPIPPSLIAPGLPPFPIRVAPFSSSSMGQVNDNGRSSASNYNIAFSILPNCNHLTIAGINNQSHPAFDKIRQILC